MAIFSRRTLQKCVDESHSYASDTHRHVWVSKLKSTGATDYVATEWEIVLLHALSQLGKLRHEPNLGSSSRPDVVFENEKVSFCADITAVSDRGRHLLNPVRKLEERLERHFEQSGIATGGMILSVIHFGPPPYKGMKQPQILPPEDQSEALIFDENFQLFLEKVKSHPAIRRVHTKGFRDLRSLVHITYDPKQAGVWTDRYSTTPTTLLQQNPLFYALKQKADRLKKSGYKGALGIIVCDGGAEVLRPNFDGMTYSASDVVRAFLRKRRSVNFVITFSLRNVKAGLLKQRVELQMYVRTQEAWHTDLGQLFKQLVGRLPEIKQTPENALRELKFWQGRESLRLNLGGISVRYGRQAAKEVRISNRALLEILAGRVRPELIQERFSLGKEQNVFEQQLRAGCSLQSASVIRKPDDDSDEIVFEFGDPDPAASDFVTRHKSSSSGAHSSAQPNESTSALPKAVAQPEGRSDRIVFLSTTHTLNSPKAARCAPQQAPPSRPSPEPASTQAAPSPR